MRSIPEFMEHQGRIMRRRDLLAAGYDDDGIKDALAVGQIFRVRHGWYALRGTSDAITQVIRVGGRLTGLSALRTLGMFLPESTTLDVVVPRTAAGLRSPHNRRVRLAPTPGIRINWADPPRGGRPASDWIATEDEALLCVLRRENREVAVACCDALIRYRGWTTKRLESVFARAPKRTQGWIRDVDGRADAHGETRVRLRLRDAGIPFEPQVYVRGVGRLDGRVSTHVFVEVDGGQHSEDWVGLSSFESDHDRDIQLYLANGGHTFRVTYRQLDECWAACEEAIRRAYVNDIASQN